MSSPSKNFSRIEWVRSKDHRDLQTPFEDLGMTITMNCMRLTLLFMQPTRDRVGKLYTLSWCRNIDLNSAVGGVAKSSHLLGLGVDFEPLQIPTHALLSLALSGELASVGAQWDKLNLYPDSNTYHVGLRPIEDGQSRMRIYRDWERIS